VFSFSDYAFDSSAIRDRIGPLTLPTFYRDWISIEKVVFQILSGRVA